MSTLSRFRGNERGIALPLALLGLIIISVLVTTVLVSSTTESAIANAQQDAAKELYSLEGGLQEYVAWKGGSRLFAPNTTAESFTSSTGKALSISVARLYQYAPGMAPVADSTAVFAVRAEPTAGGRSLVAMVEVPLDFIDLAINAGASLGNNATIGGSIDINSTSNLCNSDTADQAVLHAAGTNLTLHGQAATNIGNDTATYEGDRAALANHILNGIDLLQVAQSADVKFGIEFDQPAFSGRPNYTNTGTLDWGCPAGLVTGCPAADSAYYPIVVIDAAPSEGQRGTVTIEGDHGQGILIVLNGDLTLRGGFQYKGIIMVEGNTDIHGGSGGSGGSKIEGALIGFGDLEICTSMDSSGDCTSNLGDSGGSSDLSSGAVIQYNKCAIDAAQAYANKRAFQGSPRDVTIGWFELVR
jgi:hypothetical protein